MEFEKYVKYDSGSHKILAAIIFDCNFKSSSDPLPLQVAEDLEDWLLRTNFLKGHNFYFLRFMDHHHPVIFPSYKKSRKFQVIWFPLFPPLPFSMYGFIHTPECNAYTLTAKIKFENNEDKLKKFEEFMAATFPGNDIHQENQGIIGYHLPKKEICWEKVFRILEEAKALFNLEDYSVR